MLTIVILRFFFNNIKFSLWMDKEDVVHIQ